MPVENCHDKLMISEVMSFVCSDSCEKGIAKEKKCLRNAQTNHLFQCMSDSKEMHWNFQSVKCLGELVEQCDGEKAGVEKQNSKKGFEKNEHPCRVEGVFVVSDWSARPYLNAAITTWKIQSSSQLPEFRK